jgi:hypothetical protein
MTYIPRLSDLLSVETESARQWQRYIQRYCKQVSEPAKIPERNLDVPNASRVSDVDNFSSTVNSETTMKVNYSGDKERALIWCNPVCLIPDQAGVKIARQVQLTCEQREQFVDLLNRHFGSTDIVFFIQRDDIFLSSTIALPQSWHSIVNVLGTNMFHVISRNKEHMHWFSLLNEVQMLLTEHNTKLLAKPTASVDLFEKNCNGIWLSDVPAWLRLDEEKKGIMLYLQQDFEQLDSWLDQQLSNVKYQQFNDRNHVVYDDQNAWQLKTSSWLKRKIGNVLSASS